MKLYFNGCSLTYGDELQQPEKYSWPSLTASSLKSSFINDAVPGGTNDRIIYKTLLNPTQYDFFFIAWTSYTRFTEYNPVDNFEINFNPHLLVETSMQASDDLKNNYHKYKDYRELYYKYWFNELFEFKKWLQQIILLQSFFRSHKKKYLMLNTFDNNLNSWLQPTESFISKVQNLISYFDKINDEQVLQEHQTIQNLVAMIDTSCFIGWNEWCIFDLKKSHPCGPRGHILESGHLTIAKKVLEHYNKIQ